MATLGCGSPEDFCATGASSMVRIPLFALVVYVYARGDRTPQLEPLLAGLATWAWIGSMKSGTGSSSIAQRAPVGARPARRPICSSSGEHRDCFMFAIAGITFAKCYPPISHEDPGRPTTVHRAS